MGHTKFRGDAAIMNGKFESNSNDYDESNLNRLHSVRGPGVVAGDSMARNEFRMDASKRSPGERSDPGVMFERRPRISHALMRATISAAF